MATCSVTYTDIVRVQRAPRVRWILITISLTLIIVAILAIVLSVTKDQDSFQADLIPVVKISITLVPVPTPQPTENPAIPSETSSPASQGLHERLALSVPVPTPPS